MRACDDLKRAFLEALTLAEQAVMTRQQAELELEEAWWNWAAACAAIVACGPGLVLGLAYLACEIAAILALRAADAAYDKAKAALKAAERAELSAFEAMFKANVAYCDCERSGERDDYPSPDEIWQDIEEAQAELEEAEDAVAEAEAANDTAEDAVAEAEDAVDEAEEAVAEAEEDDTTLIG